MQVKQLVQHGNSKALIIDKSILNAAGLDDTTLFQIVVDSNVGVTIQSVKPVNSKFEKSRDYILDKYADVFKDLADK